MKQPVTWDPPERRVDHLDYAAVRRHQRAIDRCVAAYRRRVRQELLADPPLYRQVGQLGVPLCDLERWGEAEPNGLVRVWLTSRPADATSDADHLLRRGTVLRVTGETGDQTWEGFQVQVWAVVNGSFGTAEIHTPLGGRWGGVGSLVDALIVAPSEPIASDERRADALLADLVTLAAVVTQEPDPPLPAAVLRLLSEARDLDAARVGSLANVPSDHGADAALRSLDQRAKRLVAEMDPGGLLDVLYEAVSDELWLAFGPKDVGIPTNSLVWHFPTDSLVWQSLHRAAVGVLAPGLTPPERARLGEGWQAVKGRAR